MDLYLYGVIGNVLINLVEILIDRGRIVVVNGTLTMRCYSPRVKINRDACNDASH